MNPKRMEEIEQLAHGSFGIHEYSNREGCYVEVLLSSSGIIFYVAQEKLF